MRLHTVLLLLPLLVCQAHAQTTAETTAVAAGSSPAAPSAATEPVPAPAGATHHRMSWQQRFAQANTTHDGHLTLQQAKDGYRTVARHFNEIDTAKRGYVTVEDIAAWHKLQRAMRHSNHEQRGDGLRPRPAMQHGMPAPHEINTSTDTNVAPITRPAPQPAVNSDASGTQPRHGT